MLERALRRVAFAPQWGRQMRFITGPRQSGKTTLAKQKLAQAGSPRLYYLWDLRQVRERCKGNQLFFTQDSPPRRRRQWVCFDELHKIPKWKNVLKGIYDSAQEHYRFIITGSAKFDLFRKAGDSLSGRFFSFQLFPLLLGELEKRQKSLTQEPSGTDAFIQTALDRRPAPHGLEALLRFGGFPEPFLRHSAVFHKRWSEDYMDTVIKEDIGALTRIIDKEYLYDLYRLLPQMVSNPISESSLGSHLELSHPTVKSYLRRLEDFYLAFKIHPYSKNIKRALLKAPKVYLYDWSQIADPGARFENFIAVQLSAWLHLWQESSGNRYSLFYIRTKDGLETDFLIVKNGAPWLLIETKLSDSASSAPHHYKHQEALGRIPLIEVCREEGVAAMSRKNAFRLSASRFLGS